MSAFTGQMAIAIILSGGVGRRMNSSVPKQYIEVDNKSILAYTLNVFEKNDLISEIVIVASPDWKEYIESQLRKFGIRKVVAYAEPGVCRQASILNGLKVCKEIINNYDETVVIHDAVRPMLSQELLNQCISECQHSDGVMPAFPVKDTIYYCVNGSINQLLDRSKLYSGQSPESFKFGKYLSAHKGYSEEDLKAINGSSEIAFKHGLSVKIITGDEHNYKITTESDLKRFEKEVKS